MVLLVGPNLQLNKWNLQKLEFGAHPAYSHSVKQADPRLSIIHEIDLFPPHTDLELLRIVGGVPGGTKSAKKQAELRSGERNAHPASPIA
jgi:hypothetical protein